MKLKSFMEDSFQVSPGSVKIDNKGTIERYREKYEALIKHAEFKHEIYTVNPHDRHIVHVKVPSETVDNFYYDVCLEFSGEDPSTDLMNCDVKVFSNSPSFVYSYAYVFAHWVPEGRPATGRDSMMIDRLRGKMPRDRMLIPGLEQKIGKQPTHDQPVVRNPLGIPLFDKSIYFAVFYLLDKDITWADILSVHNNIRVQVLAVNVADFDKLMNERKRLANRQKEMKKRDAETQKKAQEKEERGKVKKDKKLLKVPKILTAKKPTQAKRVSGSAKKVQTVKSSVAPKSTKR